MTGDGGRRAAGTSAGASAGGTIGKLAQSLRQDLKIALRHTFVNTLAGSVWVPRALRVALYRLVGIRALRANVNAGSRFTGTDVVIGRRTFVNAGCYFDVGGDGSLRIGEEANLGVQVTVLGMTHVVRPEGGYDRRSEHRPVRIGDRVWLGARVTVLPGVTIGDDCIVAAGAVVTQDIGPGGIWGGVPARLLRQHPAAPGPGSADVVDLTDGALLETADEAADGRDDGVVIDLRDGVDTMAAFEAETARQATEPRAGS